MKTFCIVLSLLPGLYISQVDAQQDFSLNTYKQRLEQQADLTPAQLLDLYPAGTFAEQAPTDFAGAAYSDSINRHYQLTAGEIQLIERHGFTVTQRLEPPSFGSGFLEIYKNDLPVFVSTDAILHALHMSYDAILKDVERGVLRPHLVTLLDRLHNTLPELAANYADQAAMALPLRDLDLYLTVPRRLLGQKAVALFAENNDPVAQLLQHISALQPIEYPLFATSGRTIDFSQFRVRGHYTESEELSQYFEAMMWLGRIEIYLSAPQAGTAQPSAADLKRQTVTAALLVELFERAAAHDLYQRMENIIQTMVGASDNVSLPQLQALLAETNLQRADQLLDDQVLAQFQQQLASKDYAQQRILSQILLGDPFAPQQIQPAAAFLLFGQRFIIDSFISGNVVYDKITHQGNKVFRGLPSSLDVLFSLGNNAAAQLLESELDQYHYASNLAALRYLLDAFEPQYWNTTLYSTWLNAIRALNPPAERSGLPPFMRTAPWWQQKMNTQLAAWAQLRHDNLLYAKQSYTGGIVCMYPESYVEPFPAFYDAVSTFGARGAALFASVDFSDDFLGDRIVGYFQGMAAISDSLGQIAQKQLDKAPLSETERTFLKTMLFEIPVGCTTSYGGWYSRLYYRGEEDLMLPDMVVADIHTQPTDATGAPVGHVLHVGTGPLNMAVLVAPLPDGREVAFIGPVMSYYEHVSLNFARLTDEEWVFAHARPPSFRPDFVDNYLADANGFALGGGHRLATAVESTAQASPTRFALGSSYPNPFNSTTLIPFSIPAGLSLEPVRLTVYNLSGQVVDILVEETLPAGQYTVRWNGRDRRGAPSASGIYLFKLKAGHRQQVGKLTLLK